MVVYEGHLIDGDAWQKVPEELYKGLDLWNEAEEAFLSGGLNGAEGRS